MTGRRRFFLRREGCRPVKDRCKVCLSRRNPVDKHLDYISHRHLHADDPLIRVRTVINPIFIVMPVSPLMVEPRSDIPNTAETMVNYN